MPQSSASTTAPQKPPKLFGWRDQNEALEIRFVGRDPSLPRGPADRVLEHIERPVRKTGWLRQVHSARVVPGQAGFCGEGDALCTTKTGLALAVATADCVPLVVGGPGRVAVIHAGWRGIAAGIVSASLETLNSVESDGTFDNSAADLSAWIGPAIGRCCYEVSRDVAERVAEASSERIVTWPAGQEAKPHLDLRQAVRVQLERAGISQIRQLGPCTKCKPATLWSYRREGTDAGRNWTFAWLRPSS